MLRLIGLLLLTSSCLAQPFTADEINAWKKQAANVTIVRDMWGIAHVYGKTDADAVFGSLYAQCEDDFERVEMNYVTALGRQAEVEGEGKLYHDLRVRLFQDSTLAIRLYKNVGAEMKLLMEAFAAGVNFYLHTHPQVRPKLLRRFQPWMCLLFSEGSIGGDIEAVSVNKLKDFYGDGSPVKIEEVNNDDGFEPEPKGSNGFAIAPSKSATGNALFLINPHTSFYFQAYVMSVTSGFVNVFRHTRSYIYPITRTIS